VKRRLALAAATLAATLFAVSAVPQATDRDPALLSPAPAAPPAVPEADFERLCSGHVAAVPRKDGSPGPHLVWTAYSSPTPAAELARRHVKALAGGAHEEGDDGCHLWRFEDSGRHIWDLCPLAVPTPARECGAPPEGTKSILLVSLMVGGD
jgi:hypothetical protein